MLYLFIEHKMFNHEWILSRIESYSLKWHSDLQHHTEKTTWKRDCRKLVYLKMNIGILKVP